MQDPSGRSSSMSICCSACSTLQLMLEGTHELTALTPDTGGCTAAQQLAREGAWQGVLKHCPTRMSPWPCGWSVASSVYWLPCAEELLPCTPPCSAPSEVVTGGGRQVHSIPQHQYAH